MGNLIFALTQSLDGYVAGSDGALRAPSAALFRYFIEFERTLAGVLYGRRMYEVMRYWDEDQPDWTSPAHDPEWTGLERDFATGWRAHPKWVVSRSLKSVGPNATLVDRDVEPFVRNLKATIEGDIAVAGPELAASLSDMGLIDQYQLYFRPYVLGGGKPYFARARPPLRLAGFECIAEDTIKLTYLPA